jgi:hypothetical protein
VLDLNHIICYKLWGSCIYPIETSCFENVCSKCHLTTLTTKDSSYYCYMCKCNVLVKNKAHINYKIMQEMVKEYNCILQNLGLNLWWAKIWGQLMNSMHNEVHS